MPALYRGSVMHHRLRPRRHRFRYPLFFIDFPLQRPEGLARGRLFTVDRAGLMSLQARDHGARDGSPLLPWIRSQLRRAGLDQADGEIRLQTLPRMLGYVFNPVSFWYCHDREGRLRAVLAEVNNTFGGHHQYLLHHPDQRPITDEDWLSTDKAFHVSPFCDVRGHYRFRFQMHGERRLVRLDYHDEQGLLLATSIQGRPRPWSRRQLLGAFLAYPLMSLAVIARIHLQALKLWLKGVPFLGAHPPHKHSSQEHHP